MAGMHSNEKKGFICSQSNIFFHFVSMFEFILFDLIGTTVKDSPHGNSLVIDCFRKSFEAFDIQVPAEEINKHRGKSKRDAIHELLNTDNTETQSERKIYEMFIQLLNSRIQEFSPMEGAEEVFVAAKKKGIKIGIGSGLPIRFVHTLINHLNWQRIEFDYIGSSEELGKGRPDPVMIFDAMEKLNLKNLNVILKIGDTVVDIQEGKNAGVKTACVLTGTQQRSDLEIENPDFLFQSVRELNIFF